MRRIDTLPAEGHTGRSRTCRRMRSYATVSRESRCNWGGLEYRVVLAQAIATGHNQGTCESEPTFLPLLGGLPTTRYLADPLQISPTVFTDHRTRRASWTLLGGGIDRLCSERVGVVAGQRKPVVQTYGCSRTAPWRRPAAPPLEAALADQEHSHGGHSAVGAPWRESVRRAMPAPAHVIATRRHWGRSEADPSLTLRPQGLFPSQHWWSEPYNCRDLAPGC